MSAPTPLACAGHRPHLRPPNRARALLSPAGALALLLCAACRTTTPALPPFDTASPGWNLIQTQAAWQPHSRTPTIAGDVLIAYHPDGRRLIEFSKGSLTVVTLRQTATTWRLDIPARNRHYTGTGSPPGRSAWLTLALHLSNLPLPRPWLATRPEADLLRIRNPATGEQLELPLPAAP